NDRNPTKLVRAPFSVTRSDGVNWLTRSERRPSFDTRFTLLVSVSCAENAGSMCQLCADDGAAPRVSNAPNSTVAVWRDGGIGNAFDRGGARGRLGGPSLPRLVIGVVPVIGSNVCLVGLVQHHQHDLAALDRVQRKIDGMLPGAVG